jgi:hypothetical protein
MIVPKKKVFKTFVSFANLQTSNKHRSFFSCVITIGCHRKEFIIELICALLCVCVCVCVCEKNFFYFRKAILKADP